MVEELNQVGSARRTLERQLGREPDPQEIATELGMDVDRVLDLMAWGRDHVSLDTPVDEDGDTSLGDRIQKLQSMASDAGRGPIPVTAFGVQPRPEVIAHFGDIGVERCVLWLPPVAEAEAIDRLDRHAELIHNLATAGA